MNYDDILQEESKSEQLSHQTSQEQIFAQEHCIDELEGREADNLNEAFSSTGMTFPYEETKDRALVTEHLASNDYFKIREGST